MYELGILLLTGLTNGDRATRQRLGRVGEVKLKKRICSQLKRIRFEGMFEGHFVE